MLQINFIKKWIFSLTCLLNSWEKNCIVFIFVQHKLYIYITFVIIHIINENIIMKYITLY